MKKFNSFLVGVLCIHLFLLFPFSVQSKNLADPTITTSTNAISGISYYFSEGPSVSKSFTVTASNLAGDLSIIPTTGFEVSMDNATFQNSELILPQTTDTATIYVRLKFNQTINTYQGSITVNSSNVTPIEVLLDGEIWVLEGWNYIEEFNNASLTASYSSGNFVGNNAINWAYESSRNEGGSIYNDSVYGNAIKLQSETDTKGIIYASNIPNGINNFTCTIFRGTSSAPNPKINVSINNVIQESTLIEIVSDDEFSLTINNLAVNGSFSIKIENAISGPVIVDNIKWTSYSTELTPEIEINPQAFNTFGYFEFSPTSPSQATTVSGTHLTSNLVITSTDSFEVSTDNILFNNTLTLTPTNGTLENKNIYTRLKLGQEVDRYFGNIIFTSTGLISKQMTCEAGVAADVSTPLMINEVDTKTNSYVVEGITQQFEFIEFYSGSPGVVNLDGYVVVLYNGNNNKIYKNIDLKTHSTNADGYFVIGNNGVPNAQLIINNGYIQNGPDAVALYYGNSTDFSNGDLISTINLVDAIVYGSTFTPNLMPLLNSNQAIIDEGANLLSNRLDDSMGRIPNGSGGLRNTMAYTSCYPSPGMMNYDRSIDLVTLDKTTNNTPLIYASKRTVYVKGENKGLVSIYNSQGMLVMSLLKESANIAVDLKPGFYVVKFSNSQVVTKRKILIQ